MNAKTFFWNGLEIVCQNHYVLTDKIYEIEYEELRELINGIGENLCELCTENNL